MPIHSRFLTVAGILAVLTGIGLAGAVAPALAAGDDEPATPKCKKGYVYSSTKKKCVKKTSEILNDDDLYSAAVAKAKSGDYDGALDLLWRIKDQKQPRVLNYIGYSTRKKGDVDKGIKYYRQALALDPNYVKAREYLGEGYLMKGDLVSAKAELGQIKDRCGVSCSEYTQLAQKIDAFKATR